MKKLVFALMMLACSFGVWAQTEENPNLTQGEQESSVPGEMIQFAQIMSSETLKGTHGDVTMKLTIMKFRGAVNFILTVDGDEFLTDGEKQRLMCQFDEGRNDNYVCINSDGGMTTKTLKFYDQSRTKFKTGLKKGQKCLVTAILQDNDSKTFTFDLKGLDLSILK